MESPPRSRIIERPRLTRLLDETDARIILLVAPAGYGKTTLARQWVAAGGRRHGWYACTSASLDVAALAAGVARAASEVVPGAGRRMVERLRAEGAPSPTPSDLAGMLAEDLKEWPDDAWLVIDDYHFAMDSEASEEFVAEALARCPVRLLATSRERPAWVTARRLLYGEILEIRQAALALTHDEAKDVLAGRETRSIAGLMALADGWPAVIGLAAHTPDLRVTNLDLPEGLYEYCADEVLGSVPRDIQDDLCVLAIPAVITHDLLRRFLGRRSDRALQISMRIGFLSLRRRNQWEFQPLFRAFLLQRLVTDSQLLGSDATRAISEYLLEKGHWDDVYGLIEAAKADALLEPLIEASLPDMLMSGRTESLRRWAGYGDRAGISAPILDLVQAELAFRAGQPGIAMRAAVRAATAAPEGCSWLSRAWLRAGQAANFVDQLDNAADYLGRARAAAQSSRDIKAVLRTRFIVGIEREEPESEVYLDEFAALAPLANEEEVWTALATLFRANRFGGVEHALNEGRSVLRLLHTVPPIVTTGFLHAFAHSLILSARYEEALGHLNREVREAREAGLAFVLPHALAVKSLAEAGLRRFGAASRSIDTARRYAASDDHVYLSILASTFEARLHLVQGRPDRALATLDPGLPISELSPSAAGEVHALRALTYACLRNHGASREASELALGTTRSIEARVLALGASAIANAQKSPGRAMDAALKTMRAATDDGNLDSLAIVYRADPGFLSLLSSAPTSELRGLRISLVRSGDARLAPSALLHKLGVRMTVRLSPREEEVLGLVAQGMTNREIAERLFIAEVTVKVHVRHIFEKLGVRSRTEAALRVVRPFSNQ